MNNHFLAGFGAIERPTIAFTRSYPALEPSGPAVGGDVAATLSGSNLDLETVLTARIMIGELFSTAIKPHRVQPGEPVDVAVYRFEGQQGPWFGVGTTVAGHRPPGAVKRTKSDSAEEHRALDVVRGLGARIVDVRVIGGYRVIAWFPMSASLRTQVCRCPCTQSRNADWWACRWTVSADKDPLLRTPLDKPERDGTVCIPCRTHIRVRKSPPGESGSLVRAS
jgi:hypothetical protein